MSTEQQSEEISDVLKPYGIANFKVGQILIFDYEGSRNELKITKINRKTEQVWAKAVKTYSPEEVSINNAVFSQSFTNYMETQK